MHQLIKSKAAATSGQLPVEAAELQALFLASSSLIRLALCRVAQKRELAKHQPAPTPCWLGQGSRPANGCGRGPWAGNGPGVGLKQGAIIV